MSFWAFTVLFGSVAAAVWIQRQERFVLARGMATKASIKRCRSQQPVPDTTA